MRPLLSGAAAVILAALAPLATPLAAQDTEGPDASGRLLGQIRDAASGSPLPGAQVRLVETERGVVAGVDGRFQIDRLAPGEHTIEVTLLGYGSRTVAEVDVSGSTITRLDIDLDRQAVGLEAITVSAERSQGSAAVVLNEQRIADGVVSAISSEQISRSPDGDAAAAVKRVSGVSVQDGKYVFVRGLGERYTTSSLNGTRIPSPEPERRVVPLDLFPTGLLETITTSKTFTPDQPGDFSGGNVDIRTPSFPAARTGALSVSSGFSPASTGQEMLRAPSVGREWLAFATEPRALPDAAANYSGTSSRGPEVNRVVNSFRNRWSVLEGEGRMPFSMSGSLGGATPLLGQTLGYLGSLTYSRSDQAQLDEARARIGTGGVPIDAYEGESGTTSVLWGGLLNLSALIGSHSQLHVSNSYNRSADNTARREEGVDENTQAEVQIDRLTYVERSVRSSQLSGEHQLGPRHRLDWAVSHSAVNREEPDRSEFVTWLDPAQPVWFNDFEGAVRTFGSLDESAVDARASYGISLGSGAAGQHTVRVGGAYRSAEREARSQGFRIQSFDWGPQDPRWQMRPEEFFDGRHAQESDSIFLLSRELSGGSYDASDELLAGFLMAELEPMERLRLIGGARVERYDLTVESENQLGQKALTEKAYVDVLPALTGVVTLTDRQQLRVSASRTLARPEYRELAPITYREVLGGEQVIGNSELERTLIQNYDVRWEWYSGLGDVVSLGLFAKRFDGPIEQRYLARSGTDTRTFENSESATNRGVELEVGSTLARLSPSLAALSIFTNATVMESEVTTGNPDEEGRPMVGQAPYVVNGGLTWSPNTGRESATLLYNVVGERIMNARASGATVADVVQRPRHALDLSVRFGFGGNASAKIDLQNLLDTPIEVRQGEIVRETYRTGRTLSMGVSWRW